MQNHEVWPVEKPAGWPGPWPPMMSACLQAAREYARRGWRVHPLVPGQKKPLVADWPDKATTDAAIICGWWAQWPDANAGLVPGNKSGGLAVVDVDPRNDGMATLERLRQRFAGGVLPVTQMVRTGGDGYHLYFDASPWF